MIDVIGLKAVRITIPTMNAVQLNKKTNFTFEKPNVFKDKISLLFFNLIRTHIDDKNIIKGKIFIKILGTIINDKATGRTIPTL
tara:strand:+ start:402 stop:653 length:252 start_codon:yes stop_codon:yes gene_type:complete